jgi:myo-inositol-1(or 4)-monophosphatase
MVSDLHGSDTFLKTGHICAGNPSIHPQLLQVIAPHLTPALKGQ